MVRKWIVLVTTLSLVLLLASICWASEKPIGDITSTQQVIDKLFAGRALDQVEGIWFRDEKCIIAIAKTSIVNPQSPKYQNYDYLGIFIRGSIRGSSVGEMYVGLKQTEYPYSFNGVGFNMPNGYWKLLTPTLLQYDGDGSYSNIQHMPNQVFIRTYPTP